MYNNPYFGTYSSQINIDKINEQINNLEKMKSQLQQPIQQPVQQPTNLTQNFQLAPANRDVIKYAGSIDEVQRDMVIGDTPFFSKDMEVVWIKNTKGEIKTYELSEIIPKDEKDIQIELLQSQINELKKEMKKNEQPYTNVISTENATDTSKYDEPIRRSVEEDKPSSIQKLPTSKKR